MYKKISGLFLLMIMGLVACGGGSSESSNQDQRRLFDWDHSPDFVLFRIDVINENAPEFQILNGIPPCTIYGNGRVIFTADGEITQEVLEMRISDGEIRSFLEFVIGTGFYSWEDNLLNNSSNRAFRSISLNLYAEPRTVERYDDWPVDGYNTLLEACRGLSPQRALVFPSEGGWLRAYPADDQDFVTPALTEGWPRLAAFSLEELALSGSPLWVNDPPYITFFWNIAHDGRPIMILEGNSGFYVSFQVPRVSRSAPPAPVIE